MAGPVSSLTLRRPIRSSNSGLAATRAKAKAKANVEVNVPAAAAQVTAAQWVVIASLIFGGCCSNVFALEAIVKEDPKAGNLITFIQFLFVAFEGYFHFFNWRNPPFFVSKPHVPLTRYAIIVSLFFAVSVLNNYVWNYQISVPVHIIFRSGGTVLSLVVGTVAGKKYSRVQVASIVLLTAGVIIATLFDAKTKGSGNSHASGSNSTREFAIGIVILFIAQTLSAIMSQITELTYKRYGNHWRENLFFMHFLTLPMFWPMRESIVTELRTLAASRPVKISPSWLPGLAVPRQVIYLLINGLTQYVCVRGVNKLAGSATAVTVTIVLNVRKCISLLLSIYIFSNRLSIGTLAGAGLVFAGAAWYGIESSRLREAGKQKK
ncbi:UAA transporter [Lipomyces japonicus]|uniref:UAA transporter n=1 Tax=Lipomyces japonicus TaxID=56871 RepID=UPI0034CF4C3E